MNRAVLIDPRFPPKEVLMDETYHSWSLIGCEVTDASIPSYFRIFADRAASAYRRKHGIANNFDPSLCMVYDDRYLRNSRDINKICSDLYSACRAKPWPILGVAIVEHCNLEQLRIMYKFIPVYLASDPRIEDRYKEIILSRDVSAYDVVLDNIEEYY